MIHILHVDHLIDLCVGKLNTLHYVFALGRTLIKIAERSGINF